MEFSFEVGQREKHIVDVRFNKWIGELNIRVDRIIQVNNFRLAFFSLVKTYELEVGVEEKHHVKIEQIRKLLFAGLRKMKYKVYIDGELSQEYEG